MTERKEIVIPRPDYKKINEISHRIECMVCEADFNTNYPNRNRINRMASEINRYLSYTRGDKT